MPPLITIANVEEWMKQVACEHLQPRVASVEARYNVSLWPGVRAHLVDPAAKAVNDGLLSVTTGKAVRK